MQEFALNIVSVVVLLIACTPFVITILQFTKYKSYMPFVTGICAVVVMIIGGVIIILFAYGAVAIKNCIVWAFLNLFG